MDLTTRRGEDGVGETVVCNGTEVCRDIVNGSQGCEVTGMIGDTAPPQRKTNSFSIRNLVGAEDSDRSADGNANSNEGKFLNVFDYNNFIIIPVNIPTFLILSPNIANIVPKFTFRIVLLSLK